MKSLIKLGMASALALSGSMAAHASMNVPVSSGTAGDVFLFADVFSGGTLTAAYAGDTGIALDTLTSSTALPSSAMPFDDANLTNFLTNKATAGTTVEWALVGGTPFTGSTGNPLLASSGTKTALAGLNGGTLSVMGGTMVTTADNINSTAGGATSILVTDPTLLVSDHNSSALNGTGFNPGALQADVYNWSQKTGAITTVGLGSSSELYVLSAADPFTSQESFADIATATLNASGLSFSANGGSTSVPLPAAVWLLGSGLLGLMGVARRKAGVGLSDLSAV